MGSNAMNTETNPDVTQDTTLIETDEQPSAESSPKRKRTMRRKKTGQARSATNAKQTESTAGFNVPIGDSGEVVRSAWHFGG
jgi:hypothetical protein